MTSYLTPVEFVYILCRSVEKYYDESFRRDFRPVVFFDGTIMWSFGGNLHTLCDLDMSHYPFDLQTCRLEFVNWAYTGDAVQLVNGSDTIAIGGNAHNSHGLWQIDSSFVEVGYYTHVDFPSATYSKITFGIRLRRKWYYYVLNLLIPACFLVVMTLSVFWLPAESGEKVSLGITVLLSFSVLLLVIMDSTPRNSDHTPILCK